MWCGCKRWKHVIKQLGDAQQIAAKHGWKYQGVNHRFNFCPFCGRNLTPRALDGAKRGAKSKSLNGKGSSRAARQ
jgi:hypothetical protein